MEDLPKRPTADAALTERLIREALIHLDVRTARLASVFVGGHESIIEVRDGASLATRVQGLPVRSVG